VVVQIVVTSDTDWMVIEGGMVEKCPYITHHDVIFDKCIPFNISQAPTKAAPTAGPTFLSEQRKLSGYINGQAVQSQNVLAEHDVVEGAAPVEFTYDDDVPTVNPEAVAAYVSCRFPLHSSTIPRTHHILSLLIISQLRLRPARRHALRPVRIQDPQQPQSHDWARGPGEWAPSATMDPDP
jgi:hypothetical protein